jgi:hypothetical protein
MLVVEVSMVPALKLFACIAVIAVILWWSDREGR